MTTSSKTKGEEEADDIDVDALYLHRRHSTIVSAPTQLLSDERSLDICVSIMQMLSDSFVASHLRQRCLASVLVSTQMQSDVDADVSLGH